MSLGKKMVDVWRHAMALGDQFGDRLGACQRHTVSEQPIELELACVPACQERSHQADPPAASPEWAVKWTVQHSTSATATS